MRSTPAPVVRPEDSEPDTIPLFELWSPARIGVELASITDGTHPNATNFRFTGDQAGASSSRHDAREVPSGFQALATALDRLRDACLTVGTDAIPDIPDDAVQTVGAAVTYYREDRELSFSLLLALARASDNRANIRALARKDTVLGVVSVMRGRLEDQPMMDVCCSILRPITIEAGLVQVLKRTDAVPALVQAAQVHVHTPCPARPWACLDWDGSEKAGMEDSLDGLGRFALATTSRGEETDGGPAAATSRSSPSTLASAQHAGGLSLPAPLSGGSTPRERGQGDYRAGGVTASEARSETFLLNALAMEDAAAAAGGGSNEAGVDPASVGPAPAPGGATTYCYYPRTAHFAIQCLANVACDSEVDPASEIRGFTEGDQGIFTRDGASGGVTRIVLAGGVPLLRAAMLAHLKQPRLLEDAVCALSNIAYCTDVVRLKVG